MTETSRALFPDFVDDPLGLMPILWPEDVLYREQEWIVESVRDDDGTYVVAGNMLGKDYVAALIIVLFFLTRNPCRVVTTSAKAEHLRVLWGEIEARIRRSKVPLDCKLGGPLVLNHQEIRKMVDGQRCPLSYVIGMVAAPDSMAAMGGHHIAKTGDGIPRTMFVVDEASSVNSEYLEVASPWTNRLLVIGNAWQCENFFKWAVEGNPASNDPGGDVPREGSPGYHRRVFRITAEDSPNVRYAKAQIAAGFKPDDRMLVPGVLSWSEYEQRRKLWDPVRQCVSLDARFWRGKDVLLYPQEWMQRAKRIAAKLRGVKRQALAIGADPAEGGDSTCFAAVDMLGLIELRSIKTPDTDVCVQEALAFMRKHNVPPEQFLWDRGGGGKQHADRMRAMGLPVRTVAFGETLALEPRRGTIQVETRRENREERYAYRNRRAQMYHELRLLLDPTDSVEGWGIPDEHGELFRQMAPIPLRYDKEGQVVLLSKNKRDPGSKELTLTQLLGRSPDELDAVVLAVHGMLHKGSRASAGAAL